MFGRLLDRFSLGLIGVASFIAALMMVHIFADVVARTLFRAPLFGTMEIVAGWYMVAIAFLPLGWIAHDRGHIVVELFTQNMSAARKNLMDLFAALVCIGYMALFSWQSLIVAEEKMAINETWQAALGFIPVWPFRWLILLGALLTLVYFIGYALGHVRAIRTLAEERK